MATIRAIHGDALSLSGSADLIFTDPPFDMPGASLAGVLSRYEASHLVLITSMRQLLEFMQVPGWRLSFDFVLDGVAPKRSRNVQQPNYTHSTGVYLHKPGVKSVFNRKLRQRSDVFEANGYWPTIFHAPRERGQEHGMAKNLAAITDLLGSFDVASAVDPFAGSGTTGMAAWELGLDCTLIEKDAAAFDSMIKTLRFIGVQPQVAA